MKRMGTITWIWVGLLIVALIPVTLSVPVWKQNRYVALMREQYSLTKKERQLLNEIFSLQSEIRQKRSLERIESLGHKMGLGYFEVPVKVREIPARPKRKSREDS